MKIISILLIAFLFASCTLSYSQNQTMNIQNREIKTDTDLLKAVVFTSAHRVIGRWKYGTGFLYFSEEENTLYAITNKHAVEDCDSMGIFLKYSNQSLRDNSTFQPIANFKSECKFLNRHNNADSDLVIINLTHAGIDFNRFNIKFFTKSNLPSAQIDTLPLGSNLIDVGFPGGVSSSSIPFFIPLTLATPYYIDYNNTKQFGVNGNIVEGCSGSPIIFKDNSSHYVIGIDRLGLAYRNFIKDENGNYINYTVDLDDLINLCIKSTVLWELLEQK